jgi:flavin reductase (DIM6/NTAB) family NADH-FMN oxidoreductase RutF
MTNFSLESDPTEALKATFRRHASGVAVITMLDADKNPVGFTATSVTSLGATPPLLTFNVARGASSWPALCQRGYVAMHTLGAEDVELARKLAGPKELRFVDEDWETGPYGLPIFKDASAVLIGKIRDLHDVEANAVVIVDVLEGLVGAEKGGLLYHQRNFAGLGEVLS